MSDPDSTDAFGFSFSKKSKDAKDSSLIKAKQFGEGILKDDDYYNMNHYKRGKALIFNHYEFDDLGLSKRQGTDSDVKNVEKTFEQLKFDVFRYDDLKFGAIYDTLTEVAKEDHTDHDCLVVVVMSHGDKGRLHARDHHYPPETLWNHFTGDNCPTLAGKPKLFFIQACRGEDLDAGVKMRSRVARVAKESNESDYTLPTMADFLVMYSTIDNFYSFRSPTNGAWFIQALCNELQKRSRDQDLLTILTFVNRAIAIDYSSNVPGNYEFHKKKQVGQIVSSLTRILYFYP